MIGPLAHHPFVFRLSPKGFPKGLSISSERLTEFRRFSSCFVSLALSHCQPYVNRRITLVSGLTCRRFKDNQVRLQLFALAYNLGNFLRQLALPREVRRWSLTTLREKLIKIGAKVVSHSKTLTFQMAEVAVPRTLFASILARIGWLRAAPAMV